MENDPIPHSNLSSVNTEPAQHKAPLLQQIFIGPYGLRAGWRFLLFFAIYFAIASAVGIIARLLGAPRPSGPLVQVTPLQLSGFEGALFFYAVVASWIMAKIEGRGFGDYGLPISRAFSRDFWIGNAWGFVATSITLLAIVGFGGAHISGTSIHGFSILKAAIAWAFTFLIVGLSEEFNFRGYPQFTLATGVGFWPAALITSALFGLAHMSNGGENIFGELSVVIFGLLFCLFLRRTGNLWFAVGFHMGYDWGQTFFYGVPDSGLLPYHNLFSTVFSGPRWLTGGTVGPEASIFTPIVLLSMGAVFSLVYREVKYRPSTSVQIVREPVTSPQ